MDEDRLRARPDTGVARLLAWLDQLFARPPSPELELLWLLPRTTSGAKEAARARFAAYQAALIIRLGPPRQVAPTPHAFEHYFMAFDCLSAWYVDDRELFLGLEEAERELSISVGLRPLEP